jgi:hypothetical protein
MAQMKTILKLLFGLGRFDGKKINPILTAFGLAIAFFGAIAVMSLVISRII